MRRVGSVSLSFKLGLVAATKFKPNLAVGSRTPRRCNRCTLSGNSTWSSQHKVSRQRSSGSDPDVYTRQDLVLTNPCTNPERTPQGRNQGALPFRACEGMQHPLTHRPSGPPLRTAKQLMDWYRASERTSSVRPGRSRRREDFGRSDRSSSPPQRRVVPAPGAAPPAVVHSRAPSHPSLPGRQGMCPLMRGWTNPVPGTYHNMPRNLGAGGSDPPAMSPRSERGKSPRPLTGLGLCPNL